MPRRRNHFSTILWLLVTPLLLSACSAPGGETARKRYFWPPGAFQPRIEYVNFYHSQQDADRHRRSFFEEAILGKEQPFVVHQRPTAIAVDTARQRVYVADQAAQKVFIWDFKTAEIDFLKEPDGMPLKFLVPSGIAVDSDGAVYVVDSVSKELVFVGVDGIKRRSVALPLVRPTGIAVDSGRGRIYVVDTGGHRYAVLSEDGKLQEFHGKRGGQIGEFNFPLDADIDLHGNLYVLDSMNARVQVFSPDGSFLRKFGERGDALGSFSVGKGLAVALGMVFVTDSRANRFLVFDLEGNHLITVGGEYAVENNRVAPGGFYLPAGIDTGSDGAIWVADSLNRMFHQFQLLNDDYLREHPILPGEAFVPEGFKYSPLGQ